MVAARAPNIFMGTKAVFHLRTLPNRLYAAIWRYENKGVNHKWAPKFKSAK